MNCPNCSIELKKVFIGIEDAQLKTASWQCPQCDYFTFEPKSTKKVVKEIDKTNSKT
jgi:rubredoxin